MSTDISPLQKARRSYSPKLPSALAEHGAAVRAVEGSPTESIADQDAIRAMFPNTYGLPVVTFTGGEPGAKKARKVGVILSGGQAPGGHNVIAGLYDGLKTLSPDSVLYGFLGGPSGLVDNRYVAFDDALIDAYRNTGGFDIIGSGRTKLETTVQFDKVIANCKGLGVTGLVVVGGDDSNTNACVLAEYCRKQGADLQVIGCPKTIDGDLKNDCGSRPRSGSTRPPKSTTSSSATSSATRTARRSTGTSSS
jgi:pyrophosphate--fructose-6-phosphate 1-phosphotransferase